MLFTNYNLWKISISSSFEIKPPVHSRASQASEIVSRYIFKIQNVETGQKGRSMQSGEVPVGLWTSRQSTVPLLTLSSSVPAGPRWFPRPRLAALLPSTFPSVPVGRAPSSPKRPWDQVPRLRRPPGAAAPHPAPSPSRPRFLCPVAFSSAGITLPVCLFVHLSPSYRRLNSAAGG